MKLSGEDLRQVATLRERQRKFRRYRIPALAVHGTLVIGWLILLVAVSRFDPQYGTVALILAAHLLPIIFIGLTFSSAWLGYLLWNWRGDPRTDLLLKVVDELQKQDD